MSDYSDDDFEDYSEDEFESFDGDSPKKQSNGLEDSLVVSGLPDAPPLPQAA